MNELEKALRAGCASVCGRLFMKRLGYRVASEEFTKVTVLHVRMERHV